MRNDETYVMAARTVLKAVHLDTRERKSCAFPEAVTSHARAQAIAAHAE